MNNTGEDKMDCIWVNLKNVGPSFFKFTSVHIKMSLTQLENHSQLLCVWEKRLTETTCYQSSVSFLGEFIVNNVGPRIALFK